MAQTASLPNNTAIKLLELAAVSSGTSDGSNTTQGLKLGQNGGLSFQALLMISPEQIAAAAQGKQDASPLAAQSSDSLKKGQAAGAFMPTLLKLQAVNADGAPEDILTLADRLTSNIETMFTPQNSAPQNTALTALSNNTDNAAENILFTFNAPLGLNNKSMILTQTSALNQNNNAQNGQNKNPLQQTTLSAENIFSLMMQNEEQASQSNVSADKALNTLFSKTLSATTDTQMTQQQLKDLQDELYAGLTGFFAQFNMPQQQQTPNSDTVDFTLLTPFKGNFQAGQNPFNSSSNNNGASKADIQAAFISLTHPAANKGISNSNAGNDADFNALTQTSSKDADSVISSILSGSDNMNKGNGLKPQLMNSSALTPAHNTNIGASSANTGNSSLSFTNMFAFGTSDELNQNELEQLPEFEHALIKADIQSPASKANTMVFARQAGIPHPTSQAVAQQISLMARNNANGNSEMRMKLDPPELGNLAISLKFGKDNSVKAHLTAERPETLAMLQRDSASLQKALQDAGLDVSQDSLSFDLQGQSNGDTANQNGNQNGFHDKANNIGMPSGENSENTIETHMTVFTDPQTGQKRVNMMV